MGSSGSGKSTMMNILGCLDREFEGEYILDGISIRKIPEKNLCKVRNQKIGFVFQSFHLLPKLTALENVELPLIYAGIPKKEREERAKKMLEIVGLETDRKSTRLNSSHANISYAVFCLKKKINNRQQLTSICP